MIEPDATIVEQLCVIQAQPENEQMVVANFRLENLELNLADLSGCFERIENRLEHIERRLGLMEMKARNG
jgi:hypothetical protein